MESFIRRTIEQHVDTVLEKIFAFCRKMFEEDFSPVVKSIADALFGYVIGRTIELIASLITITYQQNYPVVKLEKCRKYIGIVYGNVFKHKIVDK